MELGKRCRSFACRQSIHVRFLNKDNPISFFDEVAFERYAMYRIRKYGNRKRI